MRKFAFLCCVFLLPIIAIGQSRVITGVVFDENNTPLPGANILIIDSNLGTATDFDGVFKLNLNDGVKEVVVSYIGYKDKTIVITESNNYSILLDIDSNALEEVVVIGYGSVLKKDLTGSVTSIKVEEKVAQQNTTVDQILQGRAAGVQVIQNGGSPNSGVSVRIRGASSLRGNNEPLYVVDGVIITSAGEDTANPGGDSVQQSQNGLNGINPRDIESMQVLKDASATAIYGSRGANGVVIITTKKGKNGKTTISGYVTSTVTELDKKIDVLNGVQFANYINEYQSSIDNEENYHVENGQVFPITYTDENPEIGAVPSTQLNWQDEIYNTGFSNSFGASFSGGTDTGNFYISTGYNDQEGIVENSRYQSGNFSMNVTQNLSDKFKVDARLSAYYAEGNFAQDGDRSGGGNRSFTSNIITYKPLLGENEDASFDDETSTSGPLTWLNDFEDVSEESRFRGSLELTYKFNIKGLSYKLQVGGDMRTKERRRFYGVTTGIGKFTNGLLAMTSLNTNSYQINNLLNYNYSFTKKQRISAVVGITYDVKSSKSTIYETSDFSTYVFGSDLPNYGQTVTKPLTILPSKTQMTSYLSRINYTFNNKYIATATYRVDGSSKFSKENRYSGFPSFSLAWKMNKEEFLRNADVLNTLKLRAGWGKTGNQAINPYQTFANYSDVLYGAGIGFAQENIPNEDLVWETTTQVNLGVNFGLLNDRISGVIDVYSKQTDDLLQLQVIPSSATFPDLLINRGSIKTEGLEISLNGAVIDKKDFRIDIGGNIAFSKNEILNLGIPNSKVYIDGELQDRSFYIGENVSSGNYFKAPANIFIEGEAIGLFYGYKTDGIYQTGDAIDVDGTSVGDVRIINLDGNDVIDAADRTIIGDPNPDFIYGGYLDVNYKRFNLGVQMHGTYGNEIINGTNVRIDYADGSANNFRSEAYVQAWRPDAQSTTYPRIGYSENLALAVNDRQVEDGSYLRISNITLGYDIPIAKTNVFSRANIYISGTNLFTFTNYSGYNPEVTNFLNNGNIMGVEWNGSPNTRSMTLGLNLNF